MNPPRPPSARPPVAAPKFISPSPGLLFNIAPADPSAVRRAQVELLVETQSLFADGMALHRAGRLEDAARCYERLLQEDPLHADALYMLSGIWLQMGRADDAIAGLRRMVALRPSAAPAHALLAAALLAQDRHGEALASLDEAIALEPRNVHAWYNSALCLAALGRIPEAESAYGRAIELDPSLVRAHVNRGQLLQQLRRHEEALQSYDAALRLGPQPAQVHHYRAEALSALGRHAEALAGFDHALASRDDLADAHKGRALSLLVLNRLPQALAAFDSALKQRADDAETWLNRGVTLQSLRRAEEAVSSYARAAALRAGYGEAHHNRGTALGELNRCEEAIAAFDEALRSCPDPAQSRFSRSLCLLKLGRLGEGFCEYRSRWDRVGRPHPMAVLPAPIWEGEGLQGKTIAVYREQGFGDTLQFIRYVTPLSKMAGRVIAVVQPPLLGLLQSIPDVELATSFEGLDCDYHIPLMCLPRLFGTTLQTIPAGVPYLSADPGKAARWARRLSGSKARLKVGLVWAGDARKSNEVANAVDRRRSLDLQQLWPLGAVPDIEFVSLQKGAPAAQARQPPPGLALTDFTDELLDFSDTAALAANLDLIITVDTAVAHLAGALGKRVWILSRFDGCWRWLNGREDSPWYPTARLFHQKTEGDWDEVVRRVAAELARAAAGRSTG